MLANNSEISLDEFLKGFDSQVSSARSPTEINTFLKCEYSKKNLESVYEILKKVV